MACIVIGPPAFITAVVSFMIKSVFIRTWHYHYVPFTHIGYVCHMPNCITVPNMSDYITMHGSLNVKLLCSNNLSLEIKKNL